MSLPTPEQIAKINLAIKTYIPEHQGKTLDYEGAKAFLEKRFEMAVEALHEVGEEVGKFLLDQAAEKAFEATTMALEGPALRAGGMAVAGVSMIALAPLSAALGPWIKAYKIGGMTEGIFGLHDLVEQARHKQPSKLAFHCACGQCADNIKYMLDKSEWRVIHMALSVATVGLWYGVKKIHSGVKAMNNTLSNKASKKDRVSYALVQSARTGCTVATAAIFLRVSEETKKKEKVAARAVAIIVSDDGWSEFEKLW